MERYSIIDPGLPKNKAGMLPVRNGSLPGQASASVSDARLGATPKVQKEANTSASLPELASFQMRFPGEDGGKSLAELALRDLDTTLQLLAERAQYITGATGAAIAARQGDQLLCRASAGASAPELGAHLQVNSGLSGESVRTRVMLRCDDAETDPRVNRDSCRALGIASVVVMPLCRDQDVRGVFELFSDKAQAFNERDLTALERMAEMVHIALDHAEAVGVNPGTAPVSGQELPEPAAESAPQAEAAPATAAEPIHAESALKDSTTAVALFEPDVRPAREMVSASVSAPESATQEDVEAQPANSTAIRDGVPAKSEVGNDVLAESSAQANTKPGGTTALPVDITPKLPTAKPVLANIRKCEKCGFPVSDGRTLCLDCDPNPSKKDLSDDANEFVEGEVPEFGPGFMNGGMALSEENQGWVLETKYVVAAALPIVALLLAWFLSRS